MDVGSDAAGGPLAVEQLGEVLQMLVEVADQDAERDLISAVDVLNRVSLRARGWTQLFEPELRQLARVLLAEIPADERVGAPGGEVAAVNAWLAQRLRAQRLSAGDGNVLAVLFRQAAAALVESVPSSASKDGGGEHA